jgi:hypothetical protein
MAYLGSQDEVLEAGKSILPILSAQARSIDSPESGRQKAICPNIKSLFQKMAHVCAVTVLITQCKLICFMHTPILKGNSALQQHT